ncbi:1-acyl-sn-glycerol-3-phosphate acyltransferase [Larkinella arboricola]|uniref:1-acyl-sn-glycerol-3-phosphate acyltransferase n=1 Tax=Larkinella arboricola TaxID=643671 RepID=A0A327WWM4_LARAB|nr:lysophospholipid acyltransferase family protein [Larkinella arboricola]RAJ97549.1 1-acyl-sn-glycerol-3-phosphate acyltransferase [Larkinella arboricola]
MVYTIWCGFWFLALFLVLFPFMFLFLQREEWKPYAHKLNYVWGRLFFWIIGMPVQVEYRYRPDPRQTYVFCANHFSYLDIAVMGVIIRNYYAFVGKSAIKRAPLFGYMFAKLHIQVDRSHANSRAYSLSKGIRTLKSGRSIMIFPEGGIRAKHPPKMFHPFKDGAFTMAVQQQVPIVPISLLNNHEIFPDKKKLRMYWRPIRAVVHPPIETRGLTQADIERLKEETYRVIDESLMNQSARVAVN